MEKRLRDGTGFFAMLIILAGLMAAPAAAGETYVVDSDHTYIWFRIQHLGIGHSYGRFSNPTGSFSFDDASASSGTIEMQVRAEDVDTGVKKRDNHLKSPDFFNAGKYPIISFKSRSFKRVSENTYAIDGNLTLMEKTRPVKITAVQTGAGKDPWGKHRRAFETKFTIKRSDFGMDFLLNVAGDAVELTVSLEGIKQ